MREEYMMHFCFDLEGQLVLPKVIVDIDRFDRSVRTYNLIFELADELTSLASMDSTSIEQQVTEWLKEIARQG